MEPERFGRTIGIGMRVASNILRDRVNRPGRENGRPLSRPAPAVSPVSRPGEQAKVFNRIPGKGVEKTRAAGRGAKKFGQAVWGPLHHAGSVLWLEVTGLFFALFAVFFAQNIYRVHGAWRRGAEHTHFLLYIALTAIFVWFSASSFLRAHKKNNKAR